MKLYFRCIAMPKQHYKYSYDKIVIFQKLSNDYASLNINI